MIPSIRQRPILLMGPPGIGKTQIMEQVARHCGIALVSYTITHHTRQSAVGLPFIREKKPTERKPYSVTEYTMSEIISSVYEKNWKNRIKRRESSSLMKSTASRRHWRLLCCSFCSAKSFGNQKVPEGWIIVAAGNPPEYNKSVREFDVVTLDRIRRIDVEEKL